MIFISEFGATDLGGWMDRTSQQRRFPLALRAAPTMLEVIDVGRHLVENTSCVAVHCVRRSIGHGQHSVGLHLGGLGLPRPAHPKEILHQSLGAGCAATDS